MNDFSTCLLTYLLSTDPDPIQVSTPQTLANGRINTGVFSIKQTVYCSQIVIAVPVGGDAASLFAAAPSGAINTNKWTLTSMELKNGNDLGLPGNQTYATFTYNCVSSTDYLINYNLVFGVFGQINQEPGPVAVLILELSGTSSNPDLFTNKNCSLTLSKILPQFYLRNFVAVSPGTPTVPATEFANGAPITFEWESNGPYFQLFIKNQPTPVYADSQTTFTLTTGVSRETTFILVASVTGNPGQDTPQGGYQPIYLYDSLTITVSNPDLTPKLVTAGSLLVTGSSELTKQLKVSGPATIANLSVNGTLSVSRATTLANATVNNSLTVAGPSVLHGGLQASAAALTLLTGAQSIGVGTYSAKTDGFVLGVCSWPSDSKYLCMCIIGGNNSDGVYATATGGNVAHFDDHWKKWQSSNGGSFLLPVRNGATWNIWVWQSSNNQVSAPFGFYWIPLGTASSGKTFERVGDSSPPPNVPSVQLVQTSKDPNLALELVAVIESLMDRPMSPEQRARLTSVLQRMNTDSR